MAQDSTHLINPHNFETGAYKLVLLSMQYGRASEEKHYYISEPTEIKSIQQNLVGFEPPIVYPFACFENQQLILCKDAQVIETISFSSNCKVVSSQNGEFHYFSLEPLIKNPQPLHQKKHEFESRTAGFNFIDSIRQDSNLVLIYPESWMEYEGQFGFFYESKNYSSEQTQLLLQKELTAKFPSEKFSLQLSSYGGSSTTFYRFHCLVYCNKSVYDNFTFYPIDNNKWKNFEVQFNSYWR